MTEITLGSSFFPKFVQNNSLFIDKSLLIKQIIHDGSNVILITRPRRWGKSLDLSMLQHFFASHVNQQPTQGLFDQLKIATVDDGLYMQHQGQYPVILISLKDVGTNSYDSAKNKIYRIVRKIFDQFPELQTSAHLSFTLREDYQAILRGEADDEQLSDSLKILSECLYAHYRKRVYILIDEYDKPLNHAYQKNYFDELSDFMSMFLSAALKENCALEKGILTGILRLSKANMLSGLNNLCEYTLLDDTYAPYFGFTEQEVSSVFKTMGLSQNLEKIKAWYNGYKVDDLVIYNPWSIMCCAANKGDLRPYWVETANSRLIEESLLNASSEIKEALQDLLEGNSIEVNIKREVTFDCLTNDPIALWSLLLFTGYLRVDAKYTREEETGLIPCKVKVPNKEVMLLFTSFFTAWFAKKSGRFVYSRQHLDDLLACNVEAFTNALKTYLTDASFHDTGKYSEMFYHGFLLAMTTQLKETHHRYSNRESGLGRYDIAIIPRTQQDGDVGVILEFKRVNKTEQLDVSAKTALQQIQHKQYDQELLDYKHIKKILHVGMAFSGKAVASAYQITDCASGNIGNTQLYQS
jgi:hypothetical protein